MESGANFRANSRDAATPKSGIRKEKCRVEVQTQKPTVYCCKFV
jgi:hypothetical protein